MGKVFRATVKMSSRVSALLRMHSSLPVEGGNCGPRGLGPAWDLHTESTRAISLN